MTVKEILDTVYAAYHRPEFIYPDPLAPVRTYSDVRDREIAGLIASSLAVGRVDLILKAVDQVLSPLGSHPSETLANLKLKELQNQYKGFVYRFFKCREISSFLYAIGEALRQYGSLESLFMEGYSPSVTLKQVQGDILAGISHFLAFIQEHSKGCCGILITPPEKGSACKRFNLFLRWMVRQDCVDPGGWTRVSKRDLLVPVDTHMHDIATRLGFTCRRAGDLKTAQEITDAFAKYDPEDPVRYDFSLTRLGIHPDLDKTILDKLT